MITNAIAFGFRLVIFAPLVEQIQFSSMMCEERLSSWKPPSSYMAPEGAVAFRPKDVVGRWRSHGGLTSSSLTITVEPDHHIRVSLETRGCMDRWRLNRTATIVGKMLLLNKPIEEYCGDPYQGLYLRQNGRELYLVPAGALERAIAFGGGRRNQIEDWVSFESFARTPDR